MAGKRILSLLLTMLITFSVIPTGVVYADEKGTRKVYLHAQGENPVETVNTSEVFLGDNVNVYFAIDNPNMGDRNDKNEHIEPQYDLNGYTLKVYYDPAFFTFAPSSKTGGNNRFDYTVPDKQMATPEQGDENIGENTGENVPQGIGYYIYDSGTKSETVLNKMYQSAYITVFFSGEYLPDRKDGQLWYNLCALPLTALKVGSSDVFMEIASSDEHTLELFAKNVSDDYPPNFNFSAINGGYHTINIKSPLKPQPPVSDPKPDSFIGNVEVTLTASSDAKIFYSDDDGVTWKEYTDEIEIERTTTIKCYAEREIDGKTYKSNIAEYTYRIVPQSPKLFDSSKVLIPNIYAENNPYSVYISDKDVFGDIEDDSTVYYTFSDKKASEISDGVNPQTEWVKVIKGEEFQKIDISSRKTIRLVTEKYGELGDVTTYYLGITPNSVTASPAGGVITAPQSVTLNCTTVGAEIYYTLDGTDPKEKGILYTEAITLNDSAKIKAVAVLDAVFGVVSSFDYLNKSALDDKITAEKPSGSYLGDVSVKLIPENPLLNVEYSTDGGVNWKPLEVGEEIILTKSTEIIARTDDGAGNKGNTYTFNYDIKPKAPVFAPEGTIFVSSADITIYAPDSTNETKDRFTLYYTTDGTDPKTSDTKKEGSKVNDTAHFKITQDTVVKAVIVDENGVFSDVVTENYYVNSDKPAIPVTTIAPGYYTQETEALFKTGFAPVTAGTKIYYTVTYGNGAEADPVPSEANEIGSETKLYVKGSQIELKGKTVIKAIAVNNDAKTGGVAPHSEMAVFGYWISPKAPTADPSGEIFGGVNPLVKVEVIPNTTVNYTIGTDNYTFENESHDPLSDLSVFYIDTQNGGAYRNADRTGEILPPSNDYSGEDIINLKLSCVLNEITSTENVYTYVIKDGEGISAPFANYLSGEYEEFDKDGSGTLIFVELDSLNADGITKIEYMVDADGNWKTYNTGDKISVKKDSVLHARCVSLSSNTLKSKTVVYAYTFVPLAPVILPPSGRYAEGAELDMTINYSENSPQNLIEDAYSLWYREGKDTVSDVFYRVGQTPRTITESTSFKSFVTNDLTQRNSKYSAVHYYIIDPSSGIVYTTYPYEVFDGESLYISKHLLYDEPYTDGIRLATQKIGASILYRYSYKTEKGTFSSEWMKYNNELPIFVNPTMDEVVVTAKLIDSLGNEIEDTQSIFTYKFVDVAVPVTSLLESGETEFDKGTKYTIIDDDDPYTVLYYSVDGSEPTTIYDGSELTINSSPTIVKAVFFKGCGECEKCIEGDCINCPNGVYGKVGEYKYTIPKTVTVSRGGGGGGGAVASAARKYTKDIFGNEHPTHIGYINGYPDGTVQPDGQITREEVTAILYRINSRSYDKPFVHTGELFHDVDIDRWSVREVEFMAENEVVLGYPDGEFKPSQDIKRAEFAALISRFAGLKKDSGENKFADLTDEHWAYRDILNLVEEKLISGYPDGTFKPENSITRAEVMTVINKLLGRKPSQEYVKSLPFEPFSDLIKDKWFYTDVIEATITHDYILDKKGVETKWENWK